jgi:hypothetical protein
VAPIPFSWVQMGLLEWKEVLVFTSDYYKNRCFLLVFMTITC